MQVQVVNAVENPEQLLCTAARNDYEDRWIGEIDYEETMQRIDPSDDVPEIAMEAYSEQYSDDLISRMWTLIRHLLKHGHFGPFEHPHITFAVEGVSRSLMAQITRHRHVTFDIQSMRYVGFDDVTPEVGEAVVSIPELETVDLAGRNAEITDEYKEFDDEDLLDSRRREYEAAIKRAFKSYNNLLDMGVAPENARMTLPIGTKINMTFTLNARMLMHVADMRAAADAQWEVREMTEEVLDLAAEWAPMTFAYYEEEMRNRKNRLSP